MGLENYQSEAQKMTDEFHRLILEDDTWTLNREHVSCLTFRDSDNSLP